MSNPHIIEKVLFTLIGMLFVLIAFSTFTEIKFDEKCKDAGGVRAGTVCVNPVAIIEVD